MILPTEIIKSNRKISRFQKQPVKLKTFSSPDSWGYVIRDLSGNLITSDFGVSPDVCRPSLSVIDLYSLAQAKRKLDADYPMMRVVSVCSTLPFAGSNERRAA
jgi:hypothetical protein